MPSIPDEGGSCSVSDKSNAELSDENTLLLLAIKHTHADDSTCLRKYCERKIRKLVDKCRLKNICFPQYFVAISTKVAENISNCTDNELIELMTECIQSLGSDSDSDRDSSSSDSSGETERRKVKKTHTGSLLTLTPKSFDRTNPYNSMWIQQRQPLHQAFHCAVHRDLMIGGAHHLCAMPQQQHDIFHAQVYGWPSLEMSGTPPPLPQATVQV